VTNCKELARLSFASHGMAARARWRDRARRSARQHRPPSLLHPAAHRGSGVANASAASPTASIKRICRGGGRSTHLPHSETPAGHQQGADQQPSPASTFVTRSCRQCPAHSGPPGNRARPEIALGLLREACLNGYRGPASYNAQALLERAPMPRSPIAPAARLLKRLRPSCSPWLSTRDRLSDPQARSRPTPFFFFFFFFFPPQWTSATNRVSTIITNQSRSARVVRGCSRKKAPRRCTARPACQHHCITIRIDGPSLRSPDSAALSQNASKPAHPRRAAATRQAPPATPMDAFTAAQPFGGRARARAPREPHHEKTPYRPACLLTMPFARSRLTGHPSRLSPSSSCSMTSASPDLGSLRHGSCSTRSATIGSRATSESIRQAPRTIRRF